MHTVDRRAYRQAIPNWGLETLRVLADIHRLVPDTECGLRYAGGLQGLEPRLGETLQSLNDAVAVLQARLSDCEHTAGQILAAITEAPRQDGQSQSGA